MANEKYIYDLPMGFGMALMQNKAARDYFDGLSDDEQRRIVSKTHEIKSKEEMQSYVNSLCTDKTIN